MLLNHWAETGYKGVDDALTALDLNSGSGFTGVVCLILLYGVDTDRSDERGQTPGDIFDEEGWTDAMRAWGGLEEEEAEEWWRSRLFVQ